MKRKNILITGSLGYIGSLLQQYLFKNKFNISGLDVGFLKLVYCMITAILISFLKI